MRMGAERLRPEWSALPEGLRARILAALGGAYVSDAPAHGGFSATYAGVVRTTGGVGFVKATGHGGHADSRDFLRQEIAVLTRTEVSTAPGLRAGIDDDVGIALVTEATDGVHPGSPWTPAQLHAVAEALRTVAESPAPAGLPEAAASMAPRFLRWDRISADAEVRQGLPDAVRRRLPDLVRMEQRFPEAVTGTRLVHGDPRADNILLQGTRARLLDWPHALAGAPWLDLPLLLPSVEAGGGPRCEEAWEIFRQHGAPAPSELLPMISAFASFLWFEQAQAEIPDLPGLRAFQRAQAVPALRWIGDLL
ncbi:aminoglycoside phosphotransferase family protein [Microbacterium resistens]|uniref:Aminoglycoside phosphotransferase family protein n=1 Tax=Microbacterium resistens TaxID=156977 RepID=A0ABY3RUB6_9MICO|nr:phosphotransferase [Microbacterium resistens]UGS27471.1 aminoglycoside phosphotransferase family protein [Microbacterium resistens]